MNNSFPILCFKHCKSKSVFCKTIPDTCPLCNCSLSESYIEPFVLPYCCKKAADDPPSIVLKPTQGTFCNDYNLSKDMHIGIVNSIGHLYEFDHRGITVNNFSDWLDCIVVHIIPESWYIHWDQTLFSLIENNKWNSCNYNVQSMNCYNFIIEFLQKLNFKDFNFVTKEQVFEKLLLPRLRYTLKYIYIYRSLKSKPYYIA
ncbi:MKRN2 opposite strand protein [Chelonus insularis]|uniref:MKRN2 opposite strand protein n=1 Tax=Chelonus insularis TaxID=460826 RepID=UPI00158F0C96|nr:MKRN2 opposite strand protein [Chelonus insularis]